MRVVILTGNERRHRFAAAHLARLSELIGIVSEAKASPLAPTAPISVDDSRVIAEHFAERDEVERGYWGDTVDFPKNPRLNIETGEINTLRVLQWVDRLAPDILVLFGTSIVHAPLLSRFQGRVINVHLGLSPFYRGSGTNFWPLVYGEPECVGATLHLAVQRVDAGDILAQVRPQPNTADRSHDLGTRVIVDAFELLPRVLQAYTQRRITPTRQSLSEGKVYRRADFNADSVRTMWSNFEAGMMTDYVTHGAQRRMERPIVEFESAFA